MRLRIQCLDIGGIIEHLVMIVEEFLFDQALAVTAKARGDIGQRIFGMILYAPGGAAIDLHLRRLHAGDGIHRQHVLVRGQRLDLIEMDRHGVEDFVLAGEDRMPASRARQADAAAEADLAAFRIAADATAGSGGDELQSPATSEQRRRTLEHGTGQFDLRLDMRATIIDM